MLSLSIGQMNTQATGAPEAAAGVSAHPSYALPLALPLVSKGFLAPSWPTALGIMSHSSLGFDGVAAALPASWAQSGWRVSAWGPPGVRLEGLCVGTSRLTIQLFVAICCSFSVGSCMVLVLKGAVWSWPIVGSKLLCSLQASCPH